MRKPGSRLLVAVSILLSGAYLCASGTLGCGSLTADSAMSALDMCFIFDCTGGAIGGLIDPCAQVGGSDRGGGGEAGTEELGGPFFADCPTEEEE